ncbi:MAG: haloacid dehalogenase [Hydrocarboniphaga sp.]|uniref:HAD family hydrolase n=1 Tax=Hydrocarboniphaga sp. TaxID=2033016 RepID=UPI002632720A|nr:HAD-IA family hydrolase [Hydrocarboniphaga sp.]MDB5971245.1 haloacid dehalogenase [Hydrocarboniphaga sp.]
MSILQLPRARPKLILFDWHATLVDTMDAMYYALDEVLPRLGPLGLIERLVPPGKSKTLEDAKLVRYIREHASLHPKIKSERRISRTDIFELLFGDDEDAKKIAHREFDHSYERYFGAVKPMEAGARDQLLALRGLGLKLGVLSNRARRFMAHEIYTVDNCGWHDLFDTMVCGDDVARRKPFPDLILKALEETGLPADGSCWYVGDSASDVVAGNNAGVTSIFYNGAGWEPAWIDKIFPGTARYPHRPDSVITTLDELVGLARQLLFANRAENVKNP